jgi:hypothetical protein
MAFGGCYRIEAAGGGASGELGCGAESLRQRREQAFGSHDGSRVSMSSLRTMGLSRRGVMRS